MSDNPLWTPKAADIHRAPVGRSQRDHAYDLSLEGFEGEPHFRYHKSILRKLRALDVRLDDALPEELEYFAFFTEVAFCASRSGSDLPGDVAPRCLRKNALPFLREAGFTVVVALGREASRLCVSELIGRAEAGKIDGPFHGLVFLGKGGGPAVVTSYHPNARRSWDRGAVVTQLYRLFDRHGIALA